ncbi:MAG: hypothetical protein KDE21_04675 [Novosphingobium sp.]|nr:hypothetical protein [Novosphingobium sp.]
MGLFDADNGRLTFGGDEDGEGGFSLSGKRNRTVKQVSVPVFYALVGALCLWLFAYISGLYPYLGTARDDTRSAPGVSTSLGKFGIGVSTMLLFEGQTAFFEYESTSAESEITLDVKPVTTLGYSDAMQRVRGEASGTAEFPITKTGLYRFRHEPALGRRYGQTKYSVSWGAR